MIIGAFVLVICAIIIVYLIQNTTFAANPPPIEGNEGSVDSTLAPTPTNLLPLASSTEPASSVEAPSLSPTNMPLPVQLPDGPTVKMISSWGSEYQYTILSAQRELLPPDSYLLHLRIRAWTNTLGGMNFWSDSFRLVVDDRRLAPVNLLNDVIAQDTTGDGDVEFEIDSSLTEAVLVITTSTNFSDNSKELRLLFP